VFRSIQALTWNICAQDCLICIGLISTIFANFKVKSSPKVTKYCLMQEILEMTLRIVIIISVNDFGELIVSSNSLILPKIVDVKNYRVESRRNKWPHVPRMIDLTPFFSINMFEFPSNLMRSAKLFWNIGFNILKMNSDLSMMRK
jgi:hypothetical protein